MSVPQPPTLPGDPADDRVDTVQKPDAPAWSAYPEFSEAPLTTYAGGLPLRPDGFARLGRAVQVLVGLCGAVSVASFGFQVWAATTLDVAGRTAEASDRALQAYDLLDLSLSGASVLLLVVSGATWLLWQHKLAYAVPPETLRRSPGWHVGSWFIPVVNLWFPFQNILDLRRAITSRSEARRIPRPYRLWWAFWLANTFIEQLAMVAAGRGLPTVASVATAAGISAFAELLNVGSAACAVLVVGDLTWRALEAKKEAKAAANRR